MVRPAGWSDCGSSPTVLPSRKGGIIGRQKGVTFESKLTGQHGTSSAQSEPNAPQVPFEFTGIPRPQTLPMRNDFAVHQRANISAAEGWDSQKMMQTTRDNLFAPLRRKNRPDGFGIFPTEVAFRVVAACWREFTSGFYAITG